MVFVVLLQIGSSYLSECYQYVYLVSSFSLDWFKLLVSMLPVCVSGFFFLFRLVQVTCLNVTSMCIWFLLSLQIGSSYLSQCYQYVYLVSSFSLDWFKLLVSMLPVCVSGFFFLFRLVQVTCLNVTSMCIWFLLSLQIGSSYLSECYQYVYLVSSFSSDWFKLLVSMLPVCVSGFFFLFRLVQVTCLNVTSMCIWFLLSLQIGSSYLSQCYQYVYLVSSFSLDWFKLLVSMLPVCVSGFFFLFRLVQVTCLNVTSMCIWFLLSLQIGSSYLSQCYQYVYLVSSFSLDWFKLLVSMLPVCVSGFFFLFIKKLIVEFLKYLYQDLFFSYYVLMTFHT